MDMGMSPNCRKTVLVLPCKMQEGTGSSETPKAIAFRTVSKYLQRKQAPAAEPAPSGQHAQSPVRLRRSNRIFALQKAGEHAQEPSRTKQQEAADPASEPAAAKRLCRRPAKLSDPYASAGYFALLPEPASDPHLRPMPHALPEQSAPRRPCLLRRSQAACFKSSNLVLYLASSLPV